MSKHFKKKRSNTFLFYSNKPAGVKRTQGLCEGADLAELILTKQNNRFKPTVITVTIWKNEGLLAGGHIVYYA